MAPTQLGRPETAAPTMRYTAAPSERLPRFSDIKSGAIGVRSWLVAGPTGSAVADFYGPDAEERARDYAAYLNDNQEPIPRATVDAQIVPWPEDEEPTP